MFQDEAQECLFGRRRTTTARKMEHGFSVFLGKFNGLLGTARQNLPNGENHSAVRIPGIPFRALDVVGARCFLQRVSDINRAILGQSALWTPAAVRDSMPDREIQRGSVSAGLTS